MRILMIVMTGWWLCSSQPSLLMLEKQALTAAQRVSVTKLDAELPASTFGLWFRRLVGPRAGITWQLTECGELSVSSTPAGSDLRACVDASAVLPDGRKVTVMLTVGTFKKGVIGDPAFYLAVIEDRGELFQFRQLRDLQRRLHATRPAALPRSSSMPAIPAAGPVLHPGFYHRRAGWPTPEIKTHEGPGGPAIDEVPPAPPALGEAIGTSSIPLPEKNTAPAGGMLQGSAITKVQPRNPATAGRIKASGPVEVQIVISESGTVIEAEAISGHPLLREAAVEAALKWVFNPTTVNGVPVKTQMVLNFIFKAP